MFPPATPTNLPAAVAPVIVNHSQFRIWAFADEAITLWNTGQQYQAGTVVQIAVIVTIVIAFVFLAMAWARRLTDQGDL